MVWYMVTEVVGLLWYVTPSTDVPSNTMTRKYGEVPFQMKI